MNDKNSKKESNFKPCFELSFFMQYKGFLLQSGTKNKICKSLIFEPKSLSEEKLGRFFVLIETRLLPDQTNKILKVFQTIEEEYFKHKERDVEENFEKILNKINLDLSRLASQGFVDWIDRLNAVCVVIAGNQMNAAFTGRAKIYFLRDKELTDISQEQPEEEKTRTAFKTFTNIISGPLKSDDKLILATSEFPNFFSQEKIKRTIEKSTAEAAAQKLKEDLLSTQEDIACSAIIIDMKAKTEAPFFAKEPISIHEKEKKFFKKEDKILKDKEKSKFDYPRLDFKKEQEAFLTPSSSKLNLLKNKIRWALQNRKNLVFLLRSKVKNAFSSISSSTKPRIKQADAGQKSLFTSPYFRPKKGFALEKTKIRSQIKNLFHSLSSKLKFKTLSEKSRLYFLIAIILFGLFCINIVLLIHKKKESKISAKYEETLNLAKEKTKSASHALIYKDEDKARSLLFEAKNIIENEIQNSDTPKTYLEEAQQLLNQIQQQFDKIDHIIRLEDPILLAEKDIKFQENLLGIDEEIYLAGLENNEIYKLEEENKKLITLSIGSTNIGFFKLATTTDSSLIFYTDTPSIIEFDLESKIFEKQEINFAQESEVTDIGFYYNNLYLLDTKANQIYKHPKTISGFGNASPWLAQDIDISDTRSMAIDGYIYLLKSNGQILKFLKGSLVDFKQQQPSVPLSSASKIYTNSELENLYLVDSQNKRVVVLDKNGNLINQYTSDKFEDLKNVYVNEKAGKMYLLCGKKIFGIVLEEED